MSLRVAIACEDHTHDQYIVRPVVEMLRSAAGFPHAQVRVITDPRINGIEDLKTNAGAIVERYGPIFDAVIFAIDADQQDGGAGSRNRKTSFENMLNGYGEFAAKTVVVTARQELEVWALWGSRDEVGVPWRDVRTERHPKEVFFDPLVTKADLRAPGKGRIRLVKKSLETGWNSLKQGCDELEVLQAELTKVLHDRG